MEDCILAFDVGTSAIKAVLVTATGDILGVAVETYPLSIPRQGWAEQNPEDYWIAACKTTRKVLEYSKTAPEAVFGIALATQWKGIIAVDKSGRALYPNILWLDQRAGNEANRLNQYMDCFIGSGSQYWPRLLWFRENKKEIYADASYLLSVDSFLKLRMTGIATTDNTNSFVFSDDAVLQSRYDRILAYGEIDSRKFPKAVQSTDMCGRLTKSAAEALGLKCGTPVFGGCGDIPAIAIGAGSAALGQEHIYLGSSGWLARVDECAELGEDFQYQSLEAGRFLTISGMQSAGMSQNWVINTFYGHEAKIMRGEIYSFLEEEMERISPGSDHVLATPWIYGETPPWSADSYAMFLNVRAQHTRAHLFRAMRESVAYHLRVRRSLLDGEQQKTTSIRIVGGCALSPSWMQAFADILNTTVEIPHNARHAGALGVAFCAMVGLGWQTSLEETSKHVRIVSVFEPRKSTRNVYDRMYHAFKNLYPALQDVFHSLNAEVVD